MGAIRTLGGDLVPLRPHRPIDEHYRITLVIERLPERLVPARPLPRAQHYLPADFKPRSSRWLWAGAAAIAVGGCIAATVLLLMPAPNASVLRIALAPSIGSPAMPVQGVHSPGLTEPSGEPVGQTKGTVPSTVASIVGLAGAPANPDNPNYLQVDDLPPARSAAARALQSGVAESWSDREVSGYAVAGPVQLASNRVCRIVAVWAEAGSTAEGTTTSQLYCRSEAGGWARAHRSQSDAQSAGDRSPAAQESSSTVLADTAPAVAPSSPPPD